MKTKQQQKNAQIILNAGDDLEQVNFCTFLVGMENWDSFSEGWWFIIKLIAHLQNTFIQKSHFIEKRKPVFTQKSIIKHSGQF